jgi:Fe-S-cluster containining protein
MDTSGKSDVLAEAVARAAQCDPFLDELQALLIQAEKAVARRRPSCRACGRCCDFTAWDHRLYVSTGELALLTRQSSPWPTEALRCSYQRQTACTARDRRPLGCRAFFCIQIGKAARERLYEEYHQEIIELHTHWQQKYYYVELTEGLRLLPPSHGGLA